MVETFSLIFLILGWLSYLQLIISIYSSAETVDAEFKISGFLPVVFSGMLMQKSLRMSEIFSLSLMRSPVSMLRNMPTDRQIRQPGLQPRFPHIVWILHQPDISCAKPDKNTSLQILYNCCIYLSTCFQNTTYLLKL